MGSLGGVRVCRMECSDGIHSDLRDEPYRVCLLMPSK